MTKGNNPNPNLQLPAHPVVGRRTDQARSELTELCEALPSRGTKRATRSTTEGKVLGR